MRISDLSHHRTYRSVHGGSINLTSNTLDSTSRWTPSCSAIYFPVTQAYSELSPVRSYAWRANNKKREKSSLFSFRVTEKEGFEPSRRLPDLHP